MTSQPEQILENNLVAQLVKLGYKKVKIKDETDLLTGISIWPWKTKSKVEKNKYFYCKIEIKDGFKSLISCSKIEE